MLKPYSAWDVRTWSIEDLHAYASRMFTCDIERTMIAAAKEELKKRGGA